MTLPSFDAVEITPLGKGRYDVKLSPGENPPQLPALDLSLLSPRIPRAAGNESLTRLALVQREFNRNEIHNVLADGTDFSIANNCLERGLWEIKLAKTESGKATTLFHAWFTFPKEEYAALFRAANPGLDLERFDGLFAKYPGVGGFALPLEELRSVKSSRELSPVESYTSDPLDQLTEQKGKTKLIRTPNLSTYADVVRPSNQPITLAKFTVPGLYDPSESMTFNLSWLGKKPKIEWRQVASSRVFGEFPEIELRFDNGMRILAADSSLANLPARKERPSVEADILKLVCGIGTPTIHAKTEERAAELSEDRPRYILILDAKGNHIDTHLAGVDGLYACRERGEPGRLHIWLVSYERIALIAHFSTLWPGVSWG